MSEIKEQDRKKDQEGQAAIKRLSKPIKVRILLAQIFTILSALLSFVPYLALVWLGDIFLSAQATGEQINAVQVHKVVNLLVMAFLSKLFFHALSLIITHFADMKLRFIIQAPDRQLSYVQLDILKGEKQIGSVLILKDKCFLKPAPVKQNISLSQHVIDAGYPFLQIPAAALKDQPFRSIRTPELLGFDFSDCCHESFSPFLFGL